MPRLKGSKILKFKDNNNIKQQNNLLEIKLRSFYSKKPELLKKIFKIKKNEDKITLNLIKYFIIIYCNKYKIEINDIIVYDRFKMKTKSYSRKQFSLSNVEKKIEFSKDYIFPITILNVFKWLDDNKILNYIETNLDTIIDAKKKYIENKKSKNTNKLTGIKEKTL